MNGKLECETLIKQIWVDVLERAQLCGQDNFFEVGGDSLLAMRVMARVQEELGAEIPLRVLFDHPCLEAFAAEIARQCATQEAHAGPVGVTPPGARSAPLSFAQEGLLFMDRAGLAGLAYNVPLTLRLRGRLDVDALALALTDLVARHESLRTHFALEDGVPRQVIEPARSCAIQLIDVLCFANAHERAHEAIRANTLAPFDLMAGPLLRVVLVRCAADEYLLGLATHHIVSDGWSLLEVFTRELGELYRARVSREAARLAPPLVQYADFAAWQRERLCGALLQRHVNYWKEQLAGAPPALTLPSDRPRPAVASARGAAVSFEVPAELRERLSALGRSCDATLFMVVLAAFQMVLSKWTGQRDIVVGSPAAGRRRLEFEGLIGFFVNSLILRSQLSAEESFESFLRRVRDTTLAAYAHQDMPFEKLVAELQPARDLTRQPIVQVSLSYQNFPRKILQLPAVETSWVDDELATSKFDLSMYVTEVAAGLRGVIEYATDLFDATTVERFADSFRQALVAIAANPRARIGSVDVVNDQERRRQLTECRGAIRPFPALCLHELFDDCARTSPDVTAVADDSVELTYAQLHARANQLARALQLLGVGPEVVVGMCMRRSANAVVALLAIMKAGGVYVPIDDQLPAQRVSYLLDDAAIAVVVTESTLRDALPSFWGHTLCVDDEHDQRQIGAQSTASPRSGVTPANSACVIYTSGSTGAPKGVQVPHRGLVNLIVDQVQQFGIGRDDRVLQFARLSFDVSLLDIFLALTSGASLHLPGLRSAAAIVSQLPAFLRESAITVAVLPPSLLSATAELQSPHLRLLISGGEAFDPALARGWPRHCRFVNQYGVTETTVCATQDEACDSHDIGIGRPITNVLAYVLDDDLQPVPIGVVGQLCLAGEGLARGYLRRPGLTAQNFVADPFGVPGSRMYLTGDRARFRPDGNLNFVGRNDNQVKVRGHRIELGEIEAALRTAPAVEQAVVTAHEIARGDCRLSAYLVATRHGAIDLAELRQHCRRALPEYMVPASFMLLDELPKQSSGKIDRKRLPVPTVSVEAAAFIEPETELARAIAQIWCRVLKAERVGANDHFFELGGDSILALRVQAEAQKSGIQFSLVELFEHPRLGQLARVAAQREAPDMTRTQPFALLSERDRDAARVTGYVDAYPVSKLQLGMMFHSEWQRGSRTYQAATSHRLNLPLDLAKLTVAANAVIARHPVLRTTFHLSGYDEPLQCVSETSPVEVAYEDWTHQSAARQAALLDAFVDAEKRRGFDLAVGPLVRFAAHRLDDGHFQFTMSSPHVILDGWSDAVVLTELYEDYLALLDGHGLKARTPLAVTFHDYVAAERRALADAALEAHWERAVSALPAAQHCFHRRRAGDDEQDACDTRYLRLDAQLMQDTVECAARASVPIKSVFFAAYLRAFAAFSGHGSVVAGLVTNARLECPQGDEVAGLFLNTVPVVFDTARLPEHASWLDLARHARELEEDVLRYRAYPVVEVLRRHAGRNTIEGMFDFINFHVYHSLDERLDIVEKKPIPQTNYPLVVVVRTDAHAGYGELSITYQLACAGADQVMRFEQVFLLALQHMCERSEQAFRASSLLTAQDARDLERWNWTTKFWPDEQCLHELIAQQAARTPDAFAVAGPAGSLSYRQLDQRANQLASRLRTLGVRPEVVVGLCIERSHEMLVPILAILKAGGAYVPLDPQYPQERLALILEQCSVSVLVTTTDLQKRLPKHGAHVIDLERECGSIARESTEAVANLARPDNLAYVIFTSGSSGIPKGVQVPHAGICNLVRAEARGFGVQAGERLLQFANLSFDASVFEYAMTLCSGATLYVPEANALLAGAELAKVLAEGEVTIALLPPSALQSLGDPATLGRSHLRTIVVGGEALSTALAQSWAPHVRLINAYGPTEFSIIATRSEALRSPQIVDMGTAIGNARLYVLNDELQPVPIGAVGELYLAGGGMTRGYCGRAGLTANRFVASPFAKGERLYRTGDRVRFLPAGTIEFVGRRDRQVKLRGYRVELAEIEAVLLADPAVAQAEVVVCSQDAGASLIAYVVGRANASVDAETVRHTLRSVLPAFMLPSAIVKLEALPMNAHGKVDRAALERVAILEPARAHYEAPRTELERKLAQIWQRILKVERVGIHDDFFDLGGHSLVATRVASWIRDELEIDMPLKQLFDMPTVAQLSEYVENQIWLSGQEPPGRSDVVSAVH